MTKPIYEEETNALGDVIIKHIDETEKIWWIPTDPANSDYQRYLRWLENPDAEENGTLS